MEEILIQSCCAQSTLPAHRQMNISRASPGSLLLSQFDDLLSHETNWSATLIEITDPLELNVFCQLIVLLTAKHAAEFNRRICVKAGRFHIAQHKGAHRFALRCCIVPIRCLMQPVLRCSVLRRCALCASLTTRFPFRLLRMIKTPRLTACDVRRRLHLRCPVQFGASV